MSDSLIPNPQEDRLLDAPHKQGGAGPVVGIIIIVVLMIVGALYFWGAHLNSQPNAVQQLPLIPAADSTTTIITSTTSTTTAQ